MGSKAKIAKYIVPIIQRKIDESGARYYVEPFAGGCNVIDKIKAEYRIASDSNKYLIALFQHLQDGGYAGYGKDKGRVRDYYRESRNNILMQMQQGGISGIDFSCRDYKSYTPQGCVIYCDPPYEGTKKYGNAKDFDYLEFWETMRKWSRHNNIVLISELQAPDDFITIWEKEVDRSMKAKEHFRATEKLFMWGGVTVND